MHQKHFIIPSSIHLDNLQATLVIFIVAPDVRFLHGSEITVLFFDPFLSLFSNLSLVRLQEYALSPDNNNDQKKKKITGYFLYFLCLLAVYIIRSSG